MKLSEAISRINEIRPNGCTLEQAASWLSYVDGRVKKEIIDTHKDGEAVIFNGYTSDTDGDTVLLVSAPYENMYIKYLEASIDYENAEYSKYNNNIALFDNIYETFSAAYNREHLPKQIKLKFF